MQVHGSSATGDAAFEAFVLAGSARLLRSAYLLTGDRAQAEDLVQVALTRTARHWAAAREHPDAYAHRVLVNLLHDWRRRLRRRVGEEPLERASEIPAAGAAPGADLAERELVLAAVRELPRRQREVVVLRFWADLSVAETAAAIGASEGTVKTHTSRALGQLRVVLSEERAEVGGVQ